MSAEDWRRELEEALEPAADRAIKIIEAAVKEATEEADYQAGDALARVEELEGQLSSQESDHDLLRELAEDRHGQQWSVNSHSHVIPSGHAGTLRTCPDRLCEAAAALLGR